MTPIPCPMCNKPFAVVDDDPDCCACFVDAKLRWKTLPPQYAAEDSSKEK